MTLSISDFPSNFAWGTATAAYQIEGATHEDGRGPSIWDVFASTPGAIADGSTGKIADDHYHRFLEDVKLMADLGFNSYRFSIAWPRIQATGSGKADSRGIRFYHRLSEALLDNGITPYATLYHWDLPAALEDAGGWLNRDTAERLGEYVHETVSGLKDVVSNWITLNEPWCSAFLGYGSGAHAPGKQQGSLSARAAHHLLLGHGRAVEAARRVSPNANVGVSLNLYSVRPASNSAADLDAARRIDGLQNRLFLEPILKGGYPEDVIEDLGEAEWFAANPPSDAREIAAPIDFLGVNYYSRYTTTVGVAEPDVASSFPGSEFVKFADTDVEHTQMGWPIHPDGLVDVLEQANAYRPELPLFITENGAAYEDKVSESGEIDDEARTEFFKAHVGACADALRRGLPLKGYFAWSLIDNWEWAWGFSRRFGIVRVDYATQARSIKKSGRWFAQLLAGRAAAK